MQSSGAQTLPRKKPSAAPVNPHRRSLRAPERRRGLPIVHEGGERHRQNESLDISSSPPQGTHASHEATKLAMQATLALLKKSQSNPSLGAPYEQPQSQPQTPSLRRANTDAIKGQTTGQTPSKTTLRQRRLQHKAAAHNARDASIATNDNPLTPTLGRSRNATPIKPLTPVKPPTPQRQPSISRQPSVSLSRQPSVSLSRQPSISFSSSQRFSQSLSSLSIANEPEDRYSQASPVQAPTPPPPSLTRSKSAKLVSANAMVHAYYTILREREPKHYLVNLTEEEAEVISQSQYAELLKLSCQKFRRGEGRDRVALAYAEEMAGIEDGGW